MNGDSRYKLFRNFMVNELQIARADIIQWVHEAIAAHIDRLVKSGEINVEAMFERAVQAQIAKMISERPSWGVKTVQEEVANRVAERIIFGIRGNMSGGK